MSRRWRIAVLLGALLAAAPSYANEVIQYFESNVEVAKDGELTVTETVRVQAEGMEIKRSGIYRDFPLTFKDAGGQLPEVTSSVLGVTRDGQSEVVLSQKTQEHGIIRIYAGQKDVQIPRGDHTYVFRYRTGRQIRWFDGKPELNWNVTGNFWHFPRSGGRAIVCNSPTATLRYVGPPIAGGSARAATIGRAAWASSARCPFQPRGRCVPARASPWSPRCPRLRSSHRAPTHCCGTNCSTTGDGSSAVSVS